MLQVGQNIVQLDDPLSKVNIDYVFFQVKSPKPEILSRINQLRVIKSVDKKQFTLLKKQLPYFVCGIFNPAIRKTENFAWIDCFIVDLDHFSSHEMNISLVRSALEKDIRTVLTFISPSEDGLKVLFQLKEKCYDSGKFSLFYKCFVSALGLQYHLEEIIDTRTCDVTRACFFSSDPNAFFNPSAELVDMADYLNFEDPNSIFEIKAEIRRLEKEKADSDVREKTSIDPDNETIKQIRAMLNPRQKRVEERICFVPEVLNDLIENLREDLTNIGFVVMDICNIQYGKKIQLCLGNKRSEINLFYGKRGFSVVQTPKTGTSSELNQLSDECISNFLYEKGYL